MGWGNKGFRHPFFRCLQHQNYTQYNDSKVFSPRATRSRSLKVVLVLVLVLETL